VNERLTRTLEVTLGGRAKGQAVLHLLDEPASLAELTRRTTASKSALRSALGQLMRVQMVIRDADRYALSARGVDVARSLIALADTAPQERSPLAAYAGQWVALDSTDEPIAASREPTTLIGELRSRGVIAAGIMRVPEAGPWHEGAQVG
jgi:DNA-binding IclR family transcriptional regulator